MIDTPVSPEVELMGTLLPGGPNVRRRVRIALHLCLERARTDKQLLSDLDELSLWLMGHGDPEAGNGLLNLADTLRQEVTR